jgi:hypothetical protein
MWHAQGSKAENNPSISKQMRQCKHTLVFCLKPGGE